MIINNILELEYAIKENNIEKIKKILKKNPEEINKIEIHRFIDMILFNEFDLFDNILKLISSKFKKNLLSNNVILLNLLKSNNINFINKYIKYINLLHNNYYIIKFSIETTNFELVKIIYKIYKKSKKYSLLNSILIFNFNNNIKVNLELIKFLIKIDKNIFNTFNNIPTIAYASLNNNLELLNILKKAGINFYYEKFNILNYYYNKVQKVQKVNNDIILYLLNNNININICDNELWLPAHYVFFNPKIFSLEVKKTILEKTNNINIQNTLGNTPLHYLVNNNNIDDYQDILVKKELDIFIKNKALYSPLTFAEKNKQNLIDLAVKSFFYHIKDKSIKFTQEKAKEYILKNKTTIYNKINNENDNHIIIGDYNYIKHNKFNANVIDLYLYIIILLQKYNILGVPYLPNSQNLQNNKKLIENKKFSNVTFNNLKEEIIKYLYHSEEIMHFRIYWADEKNYIISPKIGEAIQNIFKFKKYVFIILLIYNEFLSHANVLIFDRDKKIIIHFEPHGKISCYVGKLYETLKNIFKKELKGFKYIAPMEYLPIDAYQSMYDNGAIYDTKVGDRKGYCSAWCFWFIELYINNTKYDLKSLVSKSIKKLINTKYTFIDYIRNYANHLNNKMVELLREYNIPNKFINNIQLSQENIINILNHISLNIKQLNY